MTKPSKKLVPSSSASARAMSAQEHLQLVGEPALLAYESLDEYRALQNEFFAELKPQANLRVAIKAMLKVLRRLAILNRWLKSRRTLNISAESERRFGTRR